MESIFHFSWGNHDDRKTIGKQFLTQNRESDGVDIFVNHHPRLCEPTGISITHFFVIKPADSCPRCDNPLSSLCPVFCPTILSSKSNANAILRKISEMNPRRQFFSSNLTFQIRNRRGNKSPDRCKVEIYHFSVPFERQKFLLLRPESAF